MADYSGFTGVFDSGIGGISILRALKNRMPYEDFVYYGDTANAPYGDKDKEEIERLSLAITRHFVENGVKAVVIACNTATSAAAETIRALYPGIPVIGEEPAIKPAYEAIGRGRILVMATDATLRLEKFKKLYDTFAGKTELEICNCSGLAELIEKGDLKSPVIKNKVEELYKPYAGKTDGIVLGCTHYPLISDVIREVAGDIPLFDGSLGTARELERKLKETGQLKTCTLQADAGCTDMPEGKVLFETSSDDPDTLKLYKKVFENI